ncbi:MAG: hypothetical protein GXY37_02890 [Chloroflexi bacterium]|nr:hypothetical protein [Chloroflexota bacterium]
MSVIKGKISGIHHVGFVVSNIEKSIEFYRELGFKVRMRWIEHPEECALGLGVPGAEIELVSLEGYQVYLELIQYLKSTGDSGALPANRIGAGHFSIETDDICALYSRLQNRGMKFASEITHYPTASWVHLIDPDGIRVELIEMHE